MAKTDAPDAPAPDRSTPRRGADPSDMLARAHAARREAEAAKPIASTAIARPGIGRPGRASGGNFALKRIVIAHADNLDVSGEAPKAIDPTRCRELCVPLHTEFNKYPTLQPSEVVVAEYEDEYASEAARDRVLATQVDPYGTDGEGNPVGPVRLNLGPVDWNKHNRAGGVGGQTWMGPAGLNARV